MKSKTDTAIGDFAHITLLEHCDIVVLDKANDSCSQISLSERLVS